MATTIEWVQNPDGTKGETWNPIVGCTKISPGCTHCYAETMAKRLKAMGMQHYQDVVSDRGWTGKLQLVESALNKPLKRQKPTVYFVNSMSDLFHEEVPIDFLKQVFEVIGKTPWHVYQILTKRHEHLRKLAPQLQWHENIWMGVSVENQNYVHRVDYLREVPAKIRFLSCEPLLGSLQLNLTDIDWVIVGGESGVKHRPMQLEWAQSIRDQCQEADVAFFFKQWGGRTPKAGGRLLDDQIWDEMPKAWQQHTKKWSRSYNIHKLVAKK
ncbi:MAG: phage Gp37/Gp68 family protein [Phormidium sp.]